MATDSVSLVTEYIDAIGSKRWEQLLPLLQPDVTFGGPNIKPLTGSQEYVTALQRLGQILVRNEIKQILVTGDEAVVVYDFVTDTPVGAVPSVEWLTLRDGRIQSSRLIFERQRWPEVMQALQARLAQN